MSFKIDLHTHSIVSHDGGLTAKQYEKVLASRLDMVAITDHDSIGANLNLSSNLKDNIIVGQEIATQDGDIVGLYLTHTIPSGLSIKETISAIREQNGLVYVPHPYESFRRGLQQKQLNLFKDEFDIVEVFNARTKNHNYSELAKKFAQNNDIAMASSSDAHGMFGVGTSYTEIVERPTRETLVELLRDGSLVCKTAPILGHLNPLYNKVRKYFKKNNG